MNEDTADKGQAVGSILRPFLELVRPPALLTASADSLAGWAWVISTMIAVHQGSESGLSTTAIILTPLSLMLASTMIYAAGMATNDLFDYQEDLCERPFRPLPSGRVSQRAAWRFALSLQLGALLALALSHIYLWGTQSVMPIYFAAFTITMTYLYNKVFKNSVIAPLFMGLCRWGNFCIGASLLYSLHSTEVIDSLILTSGLALYASLGTLLYVTALTALSRHETKGGGGARLWASLLLILSTHPIWWSLVCELPINGSHIHELSLYTFTLLCTLWLYRKVKHTLMAHPSAEQVQQAVGAGIRGVALSNICLCLAFGSWSLASLILVLSLSAAKVARWFYAT